MNLKKRFIESLAPYELAEAKASMLWQELETHYQAPKRHYHNLQHLEALFQWTDKYEAALLDVETVHWAIWYHDIIYQARRQDNEEQSALLAQQRLAEIGVPAEKTEKVIAYIRATAQHLSVKAEGDLAYFLDFDLAILGASPTVYQNYAAAVRKEYAYVPGFLYRRGRKKVLRYFLASEALYRTNELKDLLEGSAFQNLQWELQALGG